MLVSTKGRYALRVMTELACHAKDEFVPLKTIARQQNISEKYLESIIGVLSKAGIIDGLRGKGGGYRLNRDASEYSVGEILRLTEGSLAPVSRLQAEQMRTRGRMPHAADVGEARHDNQRLSRPCIDCRSPRFVRDRRFSNLKSYIIYAPCGGAQIHRKELPFGSGIRK